MHELEFDDKTALVFEAEFTNCLHDLLLSNWEYMMNSCGSVALMPCERGLAVLLR